MPTIEVITDAEDQFGWAKKTITRDENGRIVATVIDYDDGNRFSEILDPDTSVLKRTFEDLSDLKKFESRSTSYFVDPDTGERLPFVLQSTKVDDNGFKEVWDNTAGTYTKTDTKDRATWREVHDNGAGRVTTTYDDGSKRTVETGPSYRSTSLQDPQGAFIYAIGEYYDVDGALTTRRVSDVAKDSIVFYEFEASQLVRITEFHGAKSKAPYNEKMTSYSENGEISAILTTYKNGREVNESYVKGVLTQQTETDTLDEFDWKTIKTEFTSTGDIATKEIAFDDGSLRFTERVVDERLGTYSTIEGDISADGEFLNSKQTYYDKNGDYAGTSVIDMVTGDEKHTWLNHLGYDTFIVERWRPTDALSLRERTCAYDADRGELTIHSDYYDGRHLMETFQDGKPKTKLFINETGWNPDIDWFEHSTTYNADGEKAQTVISYFDLRVRTDTYEDGKLVSKIIVDSGDIKTWQEKRTFYAETGGIARRETLSDTGVETVKSYEDRTLRELSRTDTLDAFDWTATLNTYDTFGDLLRSEVSYDSNDAQVYLAESRTKLEFDGDGSESWLFRTTHFDTNTGKQVTTYDALEDAPTLVAEEFGFLL